MMTRRRRLTIVILILLILFLLVAWLLYVLFSGGREEVVEVPDVAYEEEEIIEEVSDEPTRATISEQALEVEREERTAAADVVSLSKTFVERYGSYSNEANFANLEDVLPLMSASFASETQAFIESATAPEEYYGVSTRVITLDVERQDEDAGEAQVAITTQREEAVGSPQNSETKFQDIILTFIVEDGVWKVDSATWQ